MKVVWLASGCGAVSLILISASSVIAGQVVNAISAPILAVTWLILIRLAFIQGRAVERSDSSESGLSSIAPSRSVGESK